MRFSSTAVAASALVAGASASTTNYLGFNSGSTKQDNSAKFKADFEAEFTAAQNLVGAPGTFNAARLYTNIQAYSTNTPIEAFQAAIDTKTYLLLGVWASGVTNISDELTALQSAVSSLGSAFTDLVIGISIGSEDLYRNSATGIANTAGVGNQPDAIVGFINDFKSTFANTALSSIPVGHVDTWDVWGNASNQEVLNAIDWIGVDEYPYYENGKGNTLNNSVDLFETAYTNVLNIAGSKPVWVTETGWPYSGPDWDQAVASVENAKWYWDNVGCQYLFNKVPTFWYTMEDNSADKADFAITTNLSTSARWDLSCPTTFDVSFETSTASSSATATASGTGVSSATATPSGSGSGSASGTTSAATTSSTAKSAAGSVQIYSIAAYAGLALAAGVVALL